MLFSSWFFVKNSGWLLGRNFFRLGLVFIYIFFMVFRQKLGMALGSKLFSVRVRVYLYFLHSFSSKSGDGCWVILVSKLAQRVDSLVSKRTKRVDSQISKRVEGLVSKLAKRVQSLVEACELCVRTSSKRANFALRSA